MDLNEYYFKIIVNTPSGKSIEINPLAQLQVNETDIKDELKLMPAQYMLYASTYSEYKKQLDLLENEIEQVENEATKRIRREWNDENIKLTIKLIAELLVDDPEIQEKTKQLVMLRNTVNQLYYFCKALDKKYYTLKTLSFMQGQSQSGMDSEEEDINIDINKYEKEKSKLKENTQ